MYDGEPYGDEIEGGEDRNDGLNALVRIKFPNYNEFRTCNMSSALTKTLIKEYTT